LNKNQISDPGYAMELIANIIFTKPGVTFRGMENDTDIPWRRLARLAAGKVILKYPEQVALENLLDNETVANLRKVWCNTHKPTFWERHLLEGEQHARRK
jgi:hypothetical protein